MGGEPEQRRNRLMQFWEGEVLDDNGKSKPKRKKTSTPTRKQPTPKPSESTSDSSVSKQTASSRTTNTKNTATEANTEDSIMAVQTKLFEETIRGYDRAVS